MIDVMLLRELAEAVDRDRGYAKSLLTRSIRQAADELDATRWAVVELASHVHDCEELLPPRTRRIVSETRALLAAGPGEEK